MRARIRAAVEDGRGALQMLKVDGPLLMISGVVQGQVRPFTVPWHFAIDVLLISCAFAMWDASRVMRWERKRIEAWERDLAGAE